MLEQKHTHYYEITAKSSYEMGLNIGQTLADDTHKWIDKKLSDPEWGKRIQPALVYLELTKNIFLSIYRNFQVKQKGWVYHYLKCGH